MALLEVENLEIAVSTQRNLLPVVQDVSFTVDENETLGIKPVIEQECETVRSSTLRVCVSVRDKY